MKKRIIFLLLALAPGMLSLPGAEQTAAGSKVQSPSTLEINIGSALRPEMVSEPLSITSGEKRVINLPFTIESCKSNSANVKIEAVNGSSFEISGVTPGKAVVTVVAGGLEKEFNVTVFNSTLQTYQELGRLLEEIPEVTLELRDDGLTLIGAIANPGHWKYFRRIMAPFAERCHNYVVFQPDAQLIENLKKQLGEAGFPVVKNGATPNPGELAFQLSGGVLMISGDLLSEESIKKAQRILASQEWLNPEWNGNNFRAETDLHVAPSQIDLGIVFVGVTRNQLERLGNSSANGTVLSWDVIGWFKALYGGSPDAFSSHGDQHVGGSVLLQSNLKGSLMFFGDSGISDFRDAGHVTLTNNSKEDAVFENGGTRNVMVYGSESADLKEIEFGLKYKARALLLEGNMVKLNLDLERSLPPVKVDNDYVQRKSKTKTELLCPLGKTAVIAGQKELTFTKNGPAGYAFLRHVPVLNWFFSFEEDQGEEVQILVLVSPELMHQNVQMASRPSAETATLEKDVFTDVDSRNQAAREKEQRNWFSRMFTW
ncbi:MAG: type II and III secretion system protein [Lentisphaeria bacterium]|nr:type II and III secretion system protein [Lentisphaeria bacterium]